MNSELKDKLKRVNVSSEKDIYEFFSDNYIFFSPYERYFYLRYNEYLLVKSLFPHIFDNKSILEIGCGFGFNCFLLSSNAKHVLGMDIPEKYPSLVVGDDATSVDIAKEINNTMMISNVSFTHSWPTDIKACEDDSLDLVFSEYVLEHIPDLDLALHEMYRVLKSGGEMLHIVPVTQDAVLAFIRQQINRSRQKKYNPKNIIRNILNPVIIPGCHSEFLSDFDDQLNLYCLENYVFKMQEQGFVIKDIKQSREHNRVIYAVKP